MSPTEIQRKRALELANRRRAAKAEVRRKLKSGDVNPGRLLTEPAYAREHLDDDELEMLLRMELGDVLPRCYRIGPHKSESILKRLRLDPHVKIRHFVNGHRQHLRDELESRPIWQTWAKADAE